MIRFNRKMNRGLRIVILGVKRGSCIQQWDHEGEQDDCIDL